MRLTLSALTLLPAALSAQGTVGATNQAPAAPATTVAGSFAAQVRPQFPAIDALMKTDPEAALAKAEALIPAQSPDFDKVDPAGAKKSIDDYQALVHLYETASNSAQSAGQWEKSKDFALKAKSTAQADFDNASVPFSANQDAWKKAMADSQKNLDEMDMLAKLSKPTDEQAKRLAFLKANQGVFSGNVAVGGKQIASIDEMLNSMKAAPAVYDSFIESIDKRLKEESDNLEKFKGEKKAFVSAALMNVETIKDKASELAYLRRLLFLDPSSKSAQHKIDVLLGKAVDEPVAKPVHHKKAK